MLQIAIEQRCVDQVGAYLEQVKLRIFAAMHAGMQEAMDGLAGETIYQASVAGVRNRTGQLFTDILGSARVAETAELIIGTVDTKSEMTSGGRKFQGYLGTAIDEGFSVPAVRGNLFQFTSADQETLYSRGHRAFDVKPHPFLRKAKEAFTSPILDIIRQRVQEAYE